MLCFLEILFSKFLATQKEKCPDICDGKWDKLSDYSSFCLTF